MRVGLVVYGSLETVTGGYLYDRQLVEFLTALGDTVEVVSLPSRTYARALTESLSRSVAHRLASLDVDVLLQDELCHPSLTAANRRSRSARRTPVVAIVHLLRSDDRRRSAWHGVYAAVERRYLASVDAAVFNSDATRASAEDLLGRSVPGVVARPAADHLDRNMEPGGVERAVLSRGPVRIISVANVVPGKGATTLIEALAALPTASWRLTIAGSLSTDPSYVSQVRRRIVEADVGGSVELVGAVPHADVASLLARHDALAVPSTYEAAGIACLEGMRMGLPVIGTTMGGARELITDGVEGFLVAPEDVGALRDRLSRWVTDRDLLARMGAAARGRALRHPTWAQSFEAVRTLLTSLVARGREAAGKESPA